MIRAGRLAVVIAAPLTLAACGTTFQFGGGVVPTGVYVANRDAASVTVYALSASGNAAPLRTIAGAATGINSPTGVAVTGTGVTYVASQSLHNIVVFAGGANGNVAPIRTIGGALTQMTACLGDVIVDGSGILYVGGTCQDAVFVFAAGATGNAAPTRVISGAATAITEITGLGLDGSGNLYAGDVAVSGGKINIYAAGANGDVAPIRTISGAATGLSGPRGVVVVP